MTVFERAKELMTKVTHGYANVVKPFVDLVKAIWESRNETIQHEDIKAVDKARMPPLKQRLCLVAGRCLCSAWGKAVVEILMNMTKAVKHAYPKASREALVDGAVVAVCVGEWPPVPGADRKVAGYPAVVRFFLMPYVKLKPYEIIFHEMAASSDDSRKIRRERAEHDMLADLPGRALHLCSMSCDRPCNYDGYDFGADIDQGLHWWVGFSEVRFSNHMLGLFVPNCLNVVVRNRRLYHLWEPGRVQQPPKDKYEVLAASATAPAENVPESDVEVQLEALMNASDHSSTRGSRSVASRAPAAIIGILVFMASPYATLTTRNMPAVGSRVIDHPLSK